MAKHPRSETARVFLMTHDDPLSAFSHYGSSRENPRETYVFLGL